MVRNDFTIPSISCIKFPSRPLVGRQTLAVFQAMACKGFAGPRTSFRLTRVPARHVGISDPASPFHRINRSICKGSTEEYRSG